jgi:hypothetical protein
MAVFNQFPKTFNKTVFIAILSFIYGVVYCVPPSLETYNFELFANDFRQAGKLWWFGQTLTDYLLIGVIAYAACVGSNDRLLKAVFFAIIFDCFFSAINLIIFSDIYNYLSTCIRNGGLSSSFLFAYVVLFKEK